MVHSSQAIASHSRDDGTGTNTIIEDIFADHACSHVVLSHIRPERSLIQALGLMTYSAQRNAYEKLAG